MYSPNSLGQAIPGNALWQQDAHRLIQRRAAEEV
jgi:hypothetical protein